MSLSGNSQAGFIEVFTSSLKYLNDLLNIDNPYIILKKCYVRYILNKPNAVDTEATFLDFDFGCKDQESIQSSTTPDTGYQWESDKLTVRNHKREPRGQPFPNR